WRQELLSRHDRQRFLGEAADRQVRGRNGIHDDRMDLEMRKQNLSGERGLTLIEILVALSILALAVLALAPLFTGAIRTNASSNQLTNANTLAREKLEELSGYPRNDPRLDVPANSNAAGPPGVGVSPA